MDTVLLSQMTTAEVIEEIGRRLKALRLQQNIDVDTAANFAGLGPATLKRAEQGRNINLETLINILRSNGQLDRFGLCIPEPLPAREDLPPARMRAGRRGRPGNFRC